MYPQTCKSSFLNIFGFGQFLKKFECSQVSWLGSFLHAIGGCGDEDLICALVANSVFFS